MKKILSLVLALVMILAVACAAAESPETPGGGGVAPAVPEISIEFIGDTEISKGIIDSFKAASDAGDVLSPLPADIKDKAVGLSLTTINEMVTAKFVGDTSKVSDTVTLIIAFETKYGKGDKLLVLFGVLPETPEGEVKWSAFEGTGLEDGRVEVTVPKALFDEIKDKPFLVGVIS